MAVKSAAILLLLHLVLVCGQLGPFINPSEQPVGASPNPKNSPVYSVGNLLNITWTPVNGTVTLTIWQTMPNGTDIGGLQYLPGSESIDKTYYVWDPIGVNGNNNQPNFDLAESNIFHFDLYKQGATLAVGLSIWFNLTNSTINAQGSVISTAISSTSLTSTMSSTTMSSSTTTTTSQGSPPTPTPASPSPSSPAAPFSSNASSDLSSGAKAGIGVGAALGALVVVAGIVYAFMWTRRRRNAKANGDPTATQQRIDDPFHTKMRPEYKAEMDGFTRQQNLMETPRAEMDTSPRLVELPTDRH